jgi:diguanylate cyclase (GGDEF)-like protein
VSFKKRLHNKVLPFKSFFYPLLLLLLYFYLPIFLISSLSNHPFKILIFFYLANAILILFFANKYFIEKFKSGLEIQNLQEKINILTDENLRAQKTITFLTLKAERYHSLKKIIEEINQDLTVEFISTRLVDIAFSLIANFKGNCILYLVDNQTQRLKLFKTKKESGDLIIKAKEGDIFDSWVLRHSSPLLIEDVHKDFRFDLEKIKTEEIREISSLISAPFISENRMLGILRLDSPKPQFYSQDDLRFLATISELGAVALENGELFQRTQDLAIHDALTLLYTKAYFLERLQDECKRSLRAGTVFSLLMLDIDYFKNYNDKFGHVAGDIVLKNLSFVISDFLAEFNPIVSRFGGEEICIILPCIDKKKAHQIAENLRLKIAKMKIILRRQETRVEVSIGVAIFPLDASDKDELLNKVDRAMYIAKQQGRNRVIDA